jgi:hypothetical protein
MEWDQVLAENEATGEKPVAIPRRDDVTMLNKFTRPDTSTISDDAWRNTLLKTPTLPDGTPINQDNWGRVLELFAERPTQQTVDLFNAQARTGVWKNVNITGQQILDALAGRGEPAWVPPATETAKMMRIRGQLGTEGAPETPSGWIPESAAHYESPPTGAENVHRHTAGAPAIQIGAPNLGAILNPEALRDAHALLDAIMATHPKITGQELRQRLSEQLRTSPEKAH